MRLRDLVKKADSLFDQRKYKQALLLYNQAIEHTPDDPELYQSKGEVLARLGRYGEAVKAYDQAIKLNPKEWWYHLWKGDAFYLLRQPAKAAASYRKASALNPRSSAALYSVAISYTQLGKKRAACRALGRVLAIKPDWRTKIARDTHFKSIRGDSEFLSLIRKRQKRSK